MKVLIAGAGPTGLTAGVELARRGSTVEIIDKKDQGSTLSRAVGINPRSLDLLSPSGVTGDLLAQGVKFESVRFYREAQHWATLPLTAAPQRRGYNFMLGLPQDQTEEILRDTFVALGGTVRYGTTLTGVCQDEDRVIVETKNAGEIQCDYLVGADGVGSATRDAIGIAYDGQDLPGTWSIADVEAGWTHNNETSLCLMRDGKMALIAPLGGNRFRAVSNTDNALAALPLKINVTKTHREGQFQISLRLAREFSKGRVFLAGDAAHTHSPAGGRGMNLGIADSADLAARLCGDGDLAHYSRDRLAEDKQMIAGSEQLRKALTSPSVAKRALILAGLKLVSVTPPLQRMFASRFLYG